MSKGAIATIQDSATRLALDHARAAYKDVTDDWRDLERKGQGVIAVAGIFLGGALVFFRQIDQRTDFQVLMLLLDLSIWSWAFYAAVASLRVDVFDPPDTVRNVLIELAEVQAAATTAEAKSRYDAFVRYLAEDSEVSADSLRSVCERKVEWLQWAERASKIAIVLAFVGLIAGVLEESWVRLHA